MCWKMLRQVSCPGKCQKKPYHVLLVFCSVICGDCSRRTVVKVTVGKSQALYSSVSRRTKDKNSGLLTVGAVNIDIPQHPVALHGMMTRGSKQLSSTLQVTMHSLSVFTRACIAVCSLLPFGLGWCCTVSHVILPPVSSSLLCYVLLTDLY